MGSEVRRGAGRSGGLWGQRGGGRWGPGVMRGTSGSEVEDPIVGRVLSRVKGRTPLCGQRRVRGQDRNCHCGEGDSRSEQKFPLWGVGDHRAGWKFLLWRGRPQVRGEGTTLRGGAWGEGGSISVGKKGNLSLGQKVHSCVGRGTPGSEVRDPTVRRGARGRGEGEASWWGGRGGRC